MTDKNKHVVLDSATKKMKCNHCGETADLPGPMPLKLTTFTAMMDAFTQSHKDCVKKENSAHSYTEGSDL